MTTALPVNVAVAFDRAYQSAPAAVAVAEGETSLTFAELRTYVNGYALALREWGVSAGDVVSMQLPNWWEAHAISLAASLLGAVLNPIVSIYRDSEVSFIVMQAQSALLIVPETYRGHDFAAMAESVAAGVPQQLQVLRVRGGSEAPRVQDSDEVSALWDAAKQRDIDERAYLLYTSGSTAQPKGALHSNRTLLYEAAQIAQIARLEADDCVFMPSPITHVTGLAFGVLLPTLLGIPTVLLDRWDPRAAVDTVEAHGCTFTVSATTFLLGMTTVHEELGTTSSLKTFICGGAEIGPALVERARNSMGTRVVRTYGSTELPTFCTGDPFGDLVANAAFDGKPNPGTDYLLDSEFGLVKVGEGEALIKGGELFLGYLAVEANKQAFTDDGYFRTGDILNVDEQGNCRVVGRKKDIIIRGGENLSAIEIEDQLQLHPQIKEVAVVSMPDPVLGEKACAFVVLADPSETLTLESIRDFMKARGVAIQKVPERLEAVASLPQTASGKVQKHLLRDQIRSRLGQEAGAASA